MLGGDRDLRLVKFRGPFLCIVGCSRRVIPRSLERKTNARVLQQDSTVFPPHYSQKVVQQLDLQATPIP